MCFTSLATDSKSFLPPANCWFYTVTVFCLFIRGSAAGIFIRPPHHWWKIPEVLLLTNGWIVDFSCSHGISLCGSWISYKHWAAANMQRIKIKHEEEWKWIKEWTVCPSEIFFLVFTALVPTSWTDLGTREGSLFILVIWCDKMGWNRWKFAIWKMEVFKADKSGKGDCVGLYCCWMTAIKTSYLNVCGGVSVDGR